MLISVMAQFNGFPPHRLHASRQVSQSEALAFITTYLEASDTNAALHPNALITKNGPISASSGGATGLVLRNLARLQAGLRGEYLAPEAIVRTGEDEDIPENQSTFPPSTMQIGGIVETAEPTYDPLMGQEGWQDLSDYEREQDVERGDIGEPVPARVLNQAEKPPLPEVPEQMQPKSAEEKIDRRKKKREKRLKEKQEKRMQIQHRR